MTASHDSSPAQHVPRPAVTLPDVQNLIRTMHFAKDQARGVGGTFMWFSAEVGELAEALRHGTAEQQVGEFADVLAWLVTLANVVGIDLAEAIDRKYGQGCPGCHQMVCECPATGKP